MKICLRPTGDDVQLSYEEDPQDEGQAPSSPSLTRGWWERKLGRLQTLWQESRGGWTHRVWDRLHRRMDRDEGLLIRLHSAPKIEICHPDTLSSADVRNLWARYLASRRRRHWLWFAFNAAIAPLTVLLAPLPGPNLVGYWFVYRALRHGLILRGLRKARREEGATHFIPDSHLRATLGQPTLLATES